ILPYAMARIGIVVWSGRGWIEDLLVPVFCLFVTTLPIQLVGDEKGNVEEQLAIIIPERSGIWKPAPGIGGKGELRGIIAVEQKRLFPLGGLSCKGQEFFETTDEKGLREEDVERGVDANPKARGLQRAEPSDPANDEVLMLPVLKHCVLRPLVHGNHVMRI